MSDRQPQPERHGRLAEVRERTKIQGRFGMVLPAGASMSAQTTVPHM